MRVKRHGRVGVPPRSQMADAIQNSSRASSRRRGQGRAGLMLVTCLVALGVVTGSASAGVPKSFYGIVPYGPLSSSDFSRMHSADVGSLRISMLWPLIQSSPNGPFNWSSTDPIILGAAAQGIPLLPVVTGSPAFQSSGCGSRTCSLHIQVGSAEKRKNWQDFVVAAAQRYGPHGVFWQTHPEVKPDPITRWQIWNEENNPNEANKPLQYAKLLSITDTALHSVDPNAKVILGGMFGTPPGSSKNAAWNYLKQLYQHGAAPDFDGVAIHPYAPKISGIAQQIKKIRSVMKSHDDSSTRTYVTEIGWGSSKKVHPGTGGRGAVFNVGAKKQKKNLTAAFKLLTSHHSSWKIGGVYWFSWKDPTNPPPGLCAFCYSAGLYKPNGTSAKPALKAYKSFSRKAGKRRRSAAVR